MSSGIKLSTFNLNGIFLTDIAAGKYMLAHGGGSIINTASMSAHIVNVPQPQCAYNASKAGVIQLTKSLAIEWAKKTWSTCKLHQPGIHRNRTYTEFPDTDSTD